MLVQDLVKLMGEIAPLEYAERWDKVGLLVGDAQRPLAGPVVLAIDLTEEVLRDAISRKAGAIIAYHPPVFEPLSRVTNATPRQRVVLKAIESGIAVYSPHTALDNVPGGVTDWLCEGLSGSTEPGKVLGDCRALTPHGRSPATQQLKVVTYVPEKDVEKVRNAMASAGAGIIGRYTLCSFTTSGTGTFVGAEESTPAVGQRGRLEQVEELRLEMVCSKAALPLVLEILRQFHPYEEPAVDVYELVPQPTRGAGSGRRLVLDHPVSVRMLAERLKKFLKRDLARFALPTEHADRPVSHVGVVPGSGGELSRLAMQEGCEVFVTGEMKHHEVLGALNAGMGVILGGHTSTERGYLPRLRDKLAAHGFEALVSAMDRDILVTV